MKREITHNTHPGELLLEEIIKLNNLTIGKTAELLGVARPTLSKIVNEKSAISPTMAIRIEKVFGGSASFWLRMQATFDLREAEQIFNRNPLKLKKFNFQTA